MNYCDKIRYSIYITEVADFAVMVDNLLAQLPQDEQILRLAFFGMPKDNEQYVSRRILLREKIRKFYGNHEPVLSYVSQPPLNAGLILEVHSYKADEGDRITNRYHAGFPYVLLENAEGRFLFAGGFHGDVINFGIEQQSVEVLRLLGEVLRKEGFPVNSIIRQWNYIEQITKFEGADQHYQMFNNARSDFYANADWRNGYPAATGIGTNLGGILVDVDAAVFVSPDCYATPIDNKLQVAAHAYSEQVLEVAGKQKTTPKFERAKSMTFNGRRLVYISGTAAIRGEETLVGVGLGKQLHITMENIAELIGDAKLKMLRVYLKEKSFYEEARQLLEGYRLNIPISYMCADVCRDELLIEIEGIAIE
ncbi:endoribonuclease L-PSP [Parabacteroides sp. APC149_11_2_Y6]